MSTCSHVAVVLLKSSQMLTVYLVSLPRSLYTLTTRQPP